MKKIIALVLSLALTLLSLTSCSLMTLSSSLAFFLTFLDSSGNVDEYQGGTQGDFKFDETYRDSYVMSCYELSNEGKTKETVYIPDEFNGIPIEALGKAHVSLIYVNRFASFSSENLKRIYVPWTVNDLHFTVVYGPSGGENDPSVDVISATTCIIPARLYDNCLTNEGRYNNERFIMPNVLYEDILYDQYIGLENDDDALLVAETLFERCLPANISYFFNYCGAPNQGYFFVDLLEETGKLTKPPYDPKREGYTFAGWYKDKECEVPFNFEEDSIEISFDIEGNRIYEEFCLYAKWVAE